MIYIHSTITHKDYKLNLWQQQFLCDWFVFMFELQK